MVRIEVKEAIHDEQSSYNIKRFKLGEISIERPMRTIDAGHITKALLDENRTSMRQVLLETSKSVKSDMARKALSTPNKSQLKELFGWSQWHADFPNILTLTFKFNPHEVFTEKDALAGYLAYYYSFSDTATMVPNVDIDRSIYEDHRYVHSERIIGLDDYKRYVDEAYTILDHKNNKPIFVPLSLKLDMNGVLDLARFYSERRYLDVWVDFQGATSTDRTRLALLRGFTSQIEEMGFKDDLVIHCTNVRREITSNMKDDVSPASDVLTSVVGANIVGINREPQRPIEQGAGGPPPVPHGTLLEHKARLLDPATYYYVKLDKAGLTGVEKGRMMRKNDNLLRNALLIDGELKTQADHFLDELTIKPYISSKEMVLKYKEGFLLKGLFAPASEQQSRGEWF